VAEITNKLPLGRRLIPRERCHGLVDVKRGVFERDMSGLEKDPLRTIMVGLNISNRHNTTFKK